MAWLLVAYSLTPHHTYPTQVHEGVEALKYVLEDKHRPPSDIIIGGDSAGAGITLAVVSHLSHPSPDFPIVKIDGKLKAVVLMAPWISFRFDWPSYTSNEFKDFISVTILKKWAAAYRDGKPTNNFIEAVEAPASWWKEIQVEQLLCTAGGDEILLDSITEWVEKYKVSANQFAYIQEMCGPLTASDEQSMNPDTTTFVVGKNECHVAPIVEPMLMDTTETEQGKAIKSWLKARL